MPPVPREINGLKSWPYYPPREIVHVDVNPTTRVKNHPYFRVIHGPAVSSKISAKAGIAGTVSRLARVFGRLTTDIQIERLIVNSLPV